MAFCVPPFLTRPLLAFGEVGPQLPRLERPFAEWAFHGLRRPASLPCLCLHVDYFVTQIITCQTTVLLRIPHSPTNSLKHRRRDTEHPVPTPTLVR